MEESLKIVLGLFSLLLTFSGLFIIIAGWLIKKIETYRQDRDLFFQNELKSLRNELNKREENSYRHSERMNDSAEKLAIQVSSLKAVLLSYDDKFLNMDKICKLKHDGITEKIHEHEKRLNTQEDKFNEIKKQRYDKNDPC